MKTLGFRLSLLGLVALAAGCSTEPVDERFPIRFVATADDLSLEGVAVELGAIRLGTTGSDGRLDVIVTGHKGAAIRMSASCPERYGNVNELAPLILQPLRRIDGEVMQVRVDIHCEPTERIAMLLVRAGMEDIRVMIDGREVTRTDEAGLAHLELRGAPQQSFEVTLYTSHEPGLRPENPVRPFTMPDHDELFVFDQSFQRATRVRSRRIVRPPPPESGLPPTKLHGGANGLPGTTATSLGSRRRRSRR